MEGGLTPEPVARRQGARRKTQAVRRAADARSPRQQPGRQAKALELFASNTYRTKEEAYRIIGAQVCKAPGTIKNWIAGIPKDSPPK
ncbi:MAG: hypothetical protein IPF55_11185 [Rhodoferax sp.]|nr:hypothetical protein [Rhodoferax sp.]